MHSCILIIDTHPLPNETLNPLQLTPSSLHEQRGLIYWRHKQLPSYYTTEENVFQSFVFLIIIVWRKCILKNLQMVNQTKDILYQMI